MQIVTNASDLQAYAAEQARLALLLALPINQLLSATPTQVLSRLRAGSAHESMVKISGYLLGEFGHLLPTGPNEYFTLLQQRFVACTLPTKALLLSAYAKVL